MKRLVSILLLICWPVCGWARIETGLYTCRTDRGATPFDVRVGVNTDGDFTFTVVNEALELAVIDFSSEEGSLGLLLEGPDLQVIDVICTLK